jgi:Lrp/AsnC family leucine-responsive transcriptional regulator
MDKIDFDIINELMKNSTESFLKIAETIGISMNTVKNRCENLKKEGVILGTSTMVDLSVIGFRGKAFLFIEYSNCANSERLKEFVMHLPNVFLFANVIGEFDALAMMVYRESSEIKEISDRIRSRSCVKRVKVAVTNDTLYPLKKEFLQSIAELLK